MDSIKVSFLCQECQTAESVAERLAQFLRSATKTIDLCIYSFHLCPEPRDIILAALRDRALSGVRIRIAYDAATQQELIEEMGDDYCDLNTPDFVASLGFPSKAITGDCALMHNKYIVIDADTPQAKVWTGSANFTDDSWNLQENNILVLHSQGLANYYVHDFDEFWEDGSIASKDALNSVEVTLQFAGEPAYVSAHFSPIEGEWIDNRIADLVAQTGERATLAFVVLTSGDIISAIQGLMQRNVPIEGIYDLTQMEGVKVQWQGVRDNRWKIGAFGEIVRYANLVGKHSTPYTPTSIHDFMHNKVMVLDDLVITGSYNFSRHAQRNAENVLIIKSPALARTYREYIAKMMDKYRADPAPSKPAMPPEASERPAPTL